MKHSSTVDVQEAAAWGSFFQVPPRSWLYHEMRVLVFVVRLCANDGFQECGGEEHCAPPTKALC